MKKNMSKTRLGLIRKLSKLRGHKEVALSEQLGMYEDEYHLPATFISAANDLKHLGKRQLTDLYKQIVLNEE